MSRFKVFIEYEGTRYSGWQIQKNARTIQGELHAAITSIFKTERFEFYGSGRTDAGVHALGQVAHLDVFTTLAPEIIRRKLNDELPADISLLEVSKTNNGFHARHDAVARSYLYQISRRRTAFGKRYVWWVKDELNERVMRETLAHFKGMKDFRAFTADDPEEKSTKVGIEEVQLETFGDLILVRIVGSHFLWKMVRQMIGVVVETGRGPLKPQEVATFFSKGSSLPAQLTAPPSGLFLERVYYQGDVRLSGLIPVMPVENPFRFRS